MTSLYGDVALNIFESIRKTLNNMIVENKYFIVGSFQFFIRARLDDEDVAIHSKLKEIIVLFR